MKVSEHAYKRAQQRGIPFNIIDLIIQFGTPIEKPGKAFEYRLQKRDKIKAVSHLKHLIQSVDKIENKAVLVSNNIDEIITVYNCIK